MTVFGEKIEMGHALNSAHGCKAGKGSQPTSRKSLQKKGGKNIPFLDENIPYLEGMRGVTRALTKKSTPVVFKFLGTPLH